MNPKILVFCCVATLSYGCAPEQHIQINTAIPFTRINERTPPQRDESNDSQDFAGSKADPNTLSLNDFPFKKAELQGCYYSFVDANEPPSDQYLFVRKNDGTAYISLSSGLRTLTLISKPRRAGVNSERGFREVYRTGLYKVTLAVGFVEKNDEGPIRYQGTITIEGYDGQRVMKNVVGECGC